MSYVPTYTSLQPSVAVSKSFGSNPVIQPAQAMTSPLMRPDVESGSPAPV
jgi:hypothetical protein